MIELARYEITLREVRVVQVVRAVRTVAVRKRVVRVRVEVVLMIEAGRDVAL
jgi:hypothetical protein